MTMNEDVARLTAPEPAPRPSIAVVAGVMTGLTLVAVAAGGLLGLRVATFAKTQEANAAEAAASKPIGAYAADANLRDLPPIIANLADPPDAWVRIQASLVFDGAAPQKPDVVAAEIAQDILAFMRTVTLAEIAGASGLQHLREDLNERAAIRSNGAVRELILQTLVVQ